jgi:phosphoglycolate phosphatase-like HAD superfamily hydrolase
VSNPEVSRVVLFDIDGTLLWTDGAGRRAMEHALMSVFGAKGTRHYRYDGKTDQQIVRELMRDEGHDDESIDRRMPLVMEQYLMRLDDELSSPATSVRVLPGVLDLLDALAPRTDCLTGLLTGNLESGAARKLAVAGIDVKRFAICAYGSDHESRDRLPGIAQLRAVEHLGRDFPGSGVVIIGDTPSDIACGRHIGARAIAVATGRYSVSQLAAHTPTAVFADLRDTDRVVHAIFERNL